MLTIDRADAIRGLRAAVANKGSYYVYRQRPMYVMRNEDGSLTGACIVGCALAALGVPLELMFHGYNHGSAGILAMDLRRKGVHITDDALACFYAAQAIQDRGCDATFFVGPTSWGAALAAAERVAFEPWRPPPPQGIEAAIASAVEQMVAFTAAQGEKKTLIAA